MVVSGERRRDHNPVQAFSDGAQKRAASLAPPEERAKKSAEVRRENNGLMRVADTGGLKLPDDFTEREDKKTQLFGLDPIALIILIFALAFIAFITYLISTEPPK